MQIAFKTLILQPHITSYRSKPTLLKLNKFEELIPNPNLDPILPTFPTNRQNIILIK